MLSVRTPLRARDRKLKLGKRVFGIAVSPEMLPFQARLLPAPPVFYEGNMTHRPSLADWNIKDHKFFKAVPMKNWSYLVLGNKRIPDKFWAQFEAALNQCGMGYTNPAPYRGYVALLQGSNDDDTNDKAIADRMEKAREDDVKVLLVVLESKSAAIHAGVKRWGDLTNGMPSTRADLSFFAHTTRQEYTRSAFFHRKLATYADPKNERNALMYFANVLHKFDLKLGGINHTLSDADLDILANKNKLTMVVGIDVAHPAPRGLENTPSNVGMVASVDQIFRPMARRHKASKE